MKIRKWLRRCGWIAAGIVGLLGLAWALLQTIPGIDAIASAMILIEIGDDMSRFGDAGTGSVEWDVAIVSMG